MRAVRLILLLPLLFITQACSAASAFLPTPTPTLVPSPTPAVTSIPPLTVEQLKNAEYTLTGSDNSSHSYQLVNGEYKKGGDPTAPDYADITLLDFFPIGDLNGDGAADAAVLLAANYGGSGVFVSVAAVLNNNGQPHHVASTIVDDRPKINKLEIQNGAIFLDAVVHGPNDPMCCPAVPVTRTYKLIGPSLVMVNATSQTPDGQSRAITIDQPLSGADASGALTITGKVTIAPFENTLHMRTYNKQGNELTSGPVMVAAANPGAPGTFSFTLDLSAFPPGRMYIEIADLSAADGSIMALASVEVNVR